MKLVVQRVSKAQLSVDDQVISSIGKGYLILIGISQDDTKTQSEMLAQKLSKLRIMGDENGKMNLSVSNAKGEMLVVSQFTLFADTRSGNRPSFLAAAHPDVAKPLYEYFVEQLRKLGCKVQTGQFGADMKIASILDGPVTILIEN